MAGVHFCSHTNSTKFTDCCDTAICDDEYKCPRCGKDIPSNPRARHDMAMHKFYGYEKVRQMRDAARKKYPK